MGWLRVDLQPIKQVLVTFASKWIWTFTSYLTDQVSLISDKYHCGGKFINRVFRKMKLDLLHRPIFLKGYYK